MKTQPRHQAPDERAPAEPLVSVTPASPQPELLPLNTLNLPHTPSHLYLPQANPELRISPQHSALQSSPSDNPTLNQRKPETTQFLAKSRKRVTQLPPGISLDPTLHPHAEAHQIHHITPQRISARLARIHTLNTMKEGATYIHNPPHKRKRTPNNMDTINNKTLRAPQQLLPLITLPLNPQTLTTPPTTPPASSPTPSQTTTTSPNTEQTPPNNTPQ